MFQSKVFWTVWVPLLVLVAYFLGAAVLPEDEEWLEWYWSEFGPVEWITAGLFTAAGIVGLVVFRKSIGRVPRIWTVFYLLFGVGGIVMAGEELSWGQHTLEFATPGLIEQHNKQGEFNLHNLFNDRPSVVLRRLAEIGLPIFCIVVPLVVMAFDRKRKEAYTPGHWPYYVLPRWELIVPLVIAALCRPLNDTEEWGMPLRWHGGASEVAEMYWAIAVLIWIIILLRRVDRHPEPAATADETHPATSTASDRA